MAAPAPIDFAASLDRIEQKLDELLADKRAGRRRKLSRSAKVARRAEAGVPILPDELTQRRAAHILREHARRGVR